MQSVLELRTCDMQSVLQLWTCYMHPDMCSVSKTSQHNKGGEASVRDGLRAEIFIISVLDLKEIELQPVPISI